MNAEEIVTVSAAVVASVQLAKWARLPDNYGPAAVLIFALLGVALSVFSGTVWPPTRTDTWPIFAGWIAVATSAAGVFGFSRAAVSTLTRATPPPSGAGSEPPVSVPTVTEIADELERRREERVQSRLRQLSPPSSADTDPYRPRQDWIEGAR